MQSPVFLQYCLKLKDIVVLMEELFYSNHPFSCSGGMGGMGGMGGTPPQAQILTTIFPLWLQVFQNSKMIFSKSGVANQIGVKKDKLSSFPVRHLFL